MPGSSQTLQSIKEAHSALRERNYQRAHELAMSVLKDDPQTAGGYFVMALIAHAHGNVKKAEEVVRRALSFEADNADFLLFQAQCLLELSRHEDTKAVVAKLSLEKLSSAHQNDTLGVLHSKLGQHELALACFQRACAAKPQVAEFQFNLASCLQFTGDFTQAQAAFETVLNLDHRHFASHLALAQLNKQTADSNHLERLSSLWGSEVKTDDADACLYLGHALAKEYEDLGEYGKAMDFLQKAKQRKLAELGTNRPDDNALFTALKRYTADEKIASGGEGFDSNEPLFIVGMPRSGTTLAERILSSHSQVDSAGELANLSLLVKQQLGTSSPWVLDPQTLDKCHQLDFEKLGKDYLASTRHLTGSSAHFIDKMPLNFMYIPVILRALPKAKIICLRRNPMDTCLSNFRQLFSIRFAYYTYAYSLRDTGQFYANFHKLMDDFAHQYQGRIHQLQYENLIDNPEQQARTLIDYCGLDWEPQCLDFQTNAAPVATASSIQVREKLNRKGMGRWRKFEPWLGELKAVLEENGIHIEGN